MKKRVIVSLIAGLAEASFLNCENNPGSTTGISEDPISPASSSAQPAYFKSKSQKSNHCPLPENVARVCKSQDKKLNPYAQCSEIRTVMKDSYDAFKECVDLLFTEADCINGDVDERRQLVNQKDLAFDSLKIANEAVKAHSMNGCKIDVKPETRQLVDNIRGGIYLVVDVDKKISEAVLRGSSKINK